MKNKIAILSFLITFAIGARYSSDSAIKTIDVIMYRDCKTTIESKFVSGADIRQATYFTKCYEYGEPYVAPDRNVISIRK